jgi:hypothetical protein
LKNAESSGWALVAHALFCVFACEIFTSTRSSPEVKYFIPEVKRGLFH